MPQLGETVAEGRITAWFKHVGERIAPGDTLFEVETDKASMEVPAIGAGLLAEIRVAAGAEAPVGAVIAVIGDAPVATPSPPLDIFREVRTPERNFGRARRADGVAVTPLARRLAATAGIDLAQIAGHGSRGRIMRRDVEALIRRNRERDAAPQSGAEAVKSAYRDRPYDEIPLDRMRRTIAQRMQDAIRTIPHFHLSADIDLDRLLALRAEANAALPPGADGKPAHRISINDFLLKAYTLALQAVPEANAIWAEDRILRFRHSDIGMAVATEGGLMTPVLRDLERKSILAVAEEARELAERARAHRLQPHEYQGGAATISNLGAYGVRAFSAIINPPHATILAVGAVQRRPVEGEGGGVWFASQMTATLACDHRVLDGATGARLLVAFKRIVETPVRIVV